MTKDGGPAFPAPRYVNSGGETIALADFPDEHGMTLRDYFAGQASIGLMLSDVSIETMLEGEKQGVSLLTLRARIAYDMADAMLRARALSQSPDSAK